MSSQITSAFNKIQTSLTAHSYGRSDGFIPPSLSPTDSPDLTWSTIR